MYLLEKFNAKEVSLCSRRVCSADAQQDIDPVYQIVCNIQGQDLSYKVGDALGVFPKNAASSVAMVLEALGFSSSTLVKSSRMKRTESLEVFLSRYVDLDKFPSQLKSYFPEMEEPLTFFDALCIYQPRLPVQDIVDALCPLMPRFYSIASSPDACQGQLELLVRLVSYSGYYGIRQGVCSSFLCKDVKVGEVFSAFVQPTKHFTLDTRHRNKPLIMIGAGTGIAPYKGFVQHRIIHNDTGDNVLFFGERLSKSHSYYQEFWQTTVDQGKLKLFTAFSRDQEQKSYVQDIVRREADLVTELHAAGAYFFVCGRKTLGQEIKQVLEELIGPEAFQQLRVGGRYATDLY